MKCRLEWKWSFLNSTPKATFTRQTKVRQIRVGKLKLSRIEASPICRQQFANMFDNCFCVFHSRQLDFANTNLPNLVCRVKTA